MPPAWARRVGRRPWAYDWANRVLSDTDAKGKGLLSDDVTTWVR